MSWAVFPHQTVSSQRFFRLRGNFFVPTPEAQEELFPPCFQNLVFKIKRMKSNINPALPPFHPPSSFAPNQRKNKVSPEVNRK